MDIACWRKKCLRAWEDRIDQMMVDAAYDRNLELENGVRVQCIPDLKTYMKELQPDDAQGIQDIWWVLQGNFEVNANYDTDFKQQWMQEFQILYDPKTKFQGGTELHKGAVAKCGALVKRIRTHAIRSVNKYVKIAIKRKEIPESEKGKKRRRKLGKFRSDLVETSVVVSSLCFILLDLILLRIACFIIVLYRFQNYQPILHVKLLFQQQ